MAYSFPLAAEELADLLKIAAISFIMPDSQEYSGLASGEILGADLGPRLWMADVTTVQLSNREALAVRARLEALDGVINSFYLYDPRTKYPACDAATKGSLLSGYTPVIDSLDGNNKAMQVSGLPAGYKLTSGDMLAFDYGSPSRRALHKVVEDVTADGSGLAAMFEVRPHIRPGATTGTAITLVKPCARMRLVPKSLSEDMGTAPWITVLKFQAIQTLAAG